MEYRKATTEEAREVYNIVQGTKDAIYPHYYTQAVVDFFGRIHSRDSIAKDVTDYPDIYDLLKISDALITDYSSLIFEFSVVDPKPVFSYAKDRDSYDRGFYFDIDKLPYLFARTNKELIEGISTFDQIEYEKHLKLFYKEIDLVADGNASDRVVRYIVERIGEQ